MSHWRPGAEGACRELEVFTDSNAERYPEARDFPGAGGVSRLSPHLHFGELSPRQVWNHLSNLITERGSARLRKGIEAYLRQLVWREFAHYLLFHFPGMATDPFNPRFERFPWRKDENGLRVDQLEALIMKLRQAGKRIKFLYTIATFHNPTGATLTLERRWDLLALAAEHNILILDDDAYGELYFDEPPPPTLLALSGGHGVISVGTLSKVLATGLRVGWIIAEPGMVQMMGKMRFAMGLNQIIVRVISDWMAEGELDRHLARVRSRYRDKLAHLTQALERHVGDALAYRAPEGGFYLWAKLAEGLTAEQVWRIATREGVSLSPGFSFFADKIDPAGEHLRIAFAWTPEEELEEGARRLGRACARAARGDSV